MKNNPEKIAAIVAITQVFKYYGVPSKFCPAIAMMLGALFQYVENPTANGIIEGVVLGAATTGAYGVIKGSAQSVIPSMNKNPDTSDLEHDDYRGV